MTGSNNPLSDDCRSPRRDIRDSLASVRSANSSRVDLLDSLVGNDHIDTFASSGGLFRYLGDEPSFVANRARDDAQGWLQGARGEVHPRGASGRLESHCATAPQDFRASTPPDGQQEQGGATSRRSAEAAGLLLAPALDAAATAGERARARPFYPAKSIPGSRLVSVRTRSLYSCNRRGICMYGDTVAAAAIYFMDHTWYILSVEI